MIKIKNNFDNVYTITCGQIFRYFKEDDTYIVILKDRVISLKEDDNYIIIESNDETNLKEVIYDYFDLNRDYNLIENTIISKDSKMKEAIIYSKGLHMIHQDPFETLIAYIISQNNRVPSIANSLNLLSKYYGKKVVFNGKEYFLFPSYSELEKLSMNDFRNCKVGFRDKYLFEIIQSIKNNKLDLDSIYNMGSDESLNYLMSFKGIGMKVASCILLFAYQKFDVYPIDTWVKKFMKDDYNIEGEKNIRELLIEKHWLKGVISMPSNVFATTGTNVSILFIDKTNKENENILMDASSLGKVVKEGKNQKTVLSIEDMNKITTIFTGKKNEEDFSIVVNYEKFKEKKYSFNPGQYYDVKVSYTNISSQEFEEKILSFNNEIKKCINESHSIEKDLLDSMEKLKYE